MTYDRAPLYEPGPSFFLEDGELKFRFTIDAGNMIGPRAATDNDKARYPVAFERLETGVAVALAEFGASPAAPATPKAKASKAKA